MEKEVQIDRKRAVKYGGTDIDDWRKYTIVEDLQYSDKGGHKKRSIFNAPKHLKHWSKNT